MFSVVVEANRIGSAEQNPPFFSTQIASKHTHKHTLIKQAALVRMHVVKQWLHATHTYATQNPLKLTLFFLAVETGIYMYGKSSHIANIRI